MKKQKKEKKYLEFLLVIGIIFTILLITILNASEWSASLNDGLVSYYSFEDGSGTTIRDRVNGLYNMTSNSSVWTAGKIGSFAMNFSKASSQFARTTSNVTQLTNQNVTVNGWVKMNIQAVTTNGSGIYKIGKNINTGDGTNGNILTGLDIAEDRWVTSAPNNHSETNGTSNIADVGVWVMMTLRYDNNAKNLTTYRNGVFDSWATASLTQGDVWLAKSGQEIFFNGQLDEIGLWNRTLSQAEITQLYNGGTGITYLTDFTTTPQVTINSPANNTNSTNTYMFFNTTINVLGGAVTNVSLLINNASYSSNTSGYNGTYTFNISLSQGIYNWTINATNTNVSNVSSPRFFTLASVFNNSYNFNATTYETAQEIFYTNITTNGSVPSSSTFTYNGTTYSATVTNVVSNDYNLSTTIQIPLGGHNINRSFFFSYILNSVTYNTPTRQQNVSELVFTNINSTYSNDFLNISYKDEVSGVTINASVTTSSFVYYLGNVTINKTYTYSNSTSMFNHTFAGYPTNRNIYVLPEYQYKQGSDYPQRIWQPTIRTYNSTVYQQTLYLLNSADGIYVTFQVINNAEQVITGVNVNVTKTSDNSLVSAGTTDSSGAVTFFLNPDIQQQICFSKTGYTTNCVTIFPTQTTYTVTLSSTSTTSNDYTVGINKGISPSSDFLDQNTKYNFTYTLTSSYWTVEEFEFRLYYPNGTLILANSSTSNGGTISFYNFNVTNQTTITMNYSYIINSTSTNFTRVWIIQPTGGRSYSISNFFSRLVSYINSATGFWGLDTFGRAFLSVIIIILTVGVTTNRYGLDNEASVMAIIFSLVFLLDVTLGLIPQIQFGSITAVENFPTIVTFIILLALVIKEERS